MRDLRAEATRGGAGRYAKPLARVYAFVVLASLLLARTAYRIVDLGLPPVVEQIEPVAINNRGEVLAKTNERGFLWREGHWISLGEPTTSAGSGDPARVRPEGLNDFGVVVGGQGSLGPVFMSGLEFSVAFIWRGRGIEDLKAGSTTSAHAINDFGDVAGGDGEQAFARLRGKIVGLPTMSHVEPRDPSGEMNDVNRADAVAINGQRQILMNSTYDSKHGGTDLPRRPFLVNGNARRLTPRALPLPRGFLDALGVAVNARGTVLGVAFDRHGVGSRQPYLVRRGRIVPLPFSGAMNGRDEVVGGSPLAVWRQGKTTRLPAFAGWKLENATGINDRGAICGTGRHEGKARAFVLMPFAGFGGRR